MPPFYERDASPRLECPEDWTYPPDIISPTYYKLFFKWRWFRFNGLLLDAVEIIVSPDATLLALLFSSPWCRLGDGWKDLKWFETTLGTLFPLRSFYTLLFRYALTLLLLRSKRERFCLYYYWYGTFWAAYWFAICLFTDIAWLGLGSYLEELVLWFYIKYWFLRAVGRFVELVFGGPTCKV